MIDWNSILAILGWLFAPLCALFITSTATKNKEIRKEKAKNAELLEKHQEVQDRALKAIMRWLLVSAYTIYVKEGQPLTVERKHEITEMYQTYTELGGNGTGKAMYEAISQIPLTIVTERKGV